VIQRLGNIADNIPGVKFTVYADSDYSMMRIWFYENKEIVIFDLKSAVGEGMMVMHNLKLSPKSPYIIVLTSLNTDDFRSRCLSQGADYFFDKKKDLFKFGTFLNEHFHMVNNAEGINAEIVSNK
jgi:DNA-binding response OmpR family regulator